MNKNETLIPSLRFPEFENDGGEWLLLTGEKAFKPISNKHHTYDLPILAITQEHGAIPREEIDYHVSVSKESIKNYKVVEKGDFIISLRSFQGGIEYSKYYGICSPAYIILRLSIDSDPFYFKQYFKSTQLIADLNKNLEGLRDGKMISYKQFSEILLPIPSKIEQKKIASCLSSLDNLIESENKKLDSLKEHKKGLLQQLFPAEGENVPKVRFPEFKDDGEWEISKLGKIGPPSMCKRILKGQTTKESKNSIPFYKIGTFGRDPDSFISSTLFKEYKSKYSYPKYGDILISASGTIGRLVVFNGKDAYFQDSNIVWIANDTNIVENSFLFFIYQKVEWKTSDGGIINRLYNSDLASILIQYPINKNEQQKIASCLSSIDNLIELRTSKIESLKEHKKGLMQQLFPSNI